MENSDEKLDKTSLNQIQAFLEFRGTALNLRSSIARLQNDIRGLTATEVIEVARGRGVDLELLAGAQFVKTLSAQVDVVIHAAGIVASLPYILQPSEVIIGSSLGAGNTNQDFDLETNRQIAEFKFISWQGGAEAVRQDNLLIDVFNLDRASTDKLRCLYLVGADIPRHFLETSKRTTRGCLKRKSGFPDTFDYIYGLKAFEHVRDYWANAGQRVNIIDLRQIAPQIFGTPEPNDR